MTDADYAEVSAPQEEVQEVLASQQDQAENLKTKQMKSYQTTYKINIRKINCKWLLAPHGDAVKPYVVFRIQGSSSDVQTSPHENTKNPVYLEELCLNGFCIGSDLLKVLVFDANGNEANPETDECIAYAQIPVCDLELGHIISHTFKLFKSRDGKPLRDKRSKEGSAGTLTCEFHIADMGSISWTPKEWGATYYRVWIHFVCAEHVPLANGQQPNPYLVAKIKPAANAQEQKTATCIQSTNPYWNELHCFMADDFRHQFIKFFLFTDIDGKPHQLAKIGFPLGLAKPNEITNHNVSMNSGVGISNEKGCILRFRCQILEKNKIPFDGAVAFKHDLFKCQIQALEGKEITASPGDRPFAVLSIDQNQKQTKEADNHSEPQWDQQIVFNRVKQRQYLQVRVQDKHHSFGHVRIHLTRIPLDQETDTWYNLIDCSSGQVHLRIRLTRWVEEEDDDDPNHCHFNWNHDLQSDYSTDFTGYTNCSKTLSPTISSSSEKWHDPPHHEVDIYDVKPVREQWVKGELKGGNNIYRFTSSQELYATISLWGKAHEKKKFTVKSGSTSDFESPSFNTEFEFPRVKKGDVIHVLIWEKLKGDEEIPIANGTIVCKELQDEQDVHLELEIPTRVTTRKERKRYEPIKTFGSVDLSLKSKITFK